MNEYKIIFSKLARDDLIGITRYITENLKEPIIAQNILKKINKKIYNISENPNIYGIIKDEYVKKLEIRKVIVNNYIIFYKVTDKEIRIVRVIYAKRNWLDML